MQLAPMPPTPYPYLSQTFARGADLLENASRLLEPLNATYGGSTPKARVAAQRAALSAAAASVQLGVDTLRAAANEYVTTEPGKWHGHTVLRSLETTEGSVENVTRTLLAIASKPEVDLVQGARYNGQLAAVQLFIDTSAEQARDAIDILARSKPAAA
jgi:hypothetical protein